jgi:hypothetical protein
VPGASEALLHVIVDGANVVGSRPDGWWRDRPGAARRLAGRLVAALTQDPAALVDGLGRGGGDLRVHLVLEGAAAGVEDLPTHPRLEVVHAPADGDTAIAALAADLAAAENADRVLVVTADRALRDRVRATGAATLGPGALLDALPHP